MILTEQKQILANLVIAGVNKAGTTSLFHYLSDHPNICGSKDKETCYFLPLLYNEELSPLNNYTEQFSNCGNERYRLEATPAYFYGGSKLASEIKKNMSDVKIIIILKDPVERLISFYNRKKATLQLPGEPDFREYVKQCLEHTPATLAKRENNIYTGLSFGKYDAHIESWIQIFGENLRILFFDDLKANPLSFMKNLADWLEIESGFYDRYDFDIKNKSHHYKNKFVQKIAVKANNSGQRIWRTNPGLKKMLLQTYYKINGTPVSKSDIQNDTIEFLKKYFLPNNEKLRDILNRYGYTSLPAWLEPLKATT